MNAIKVKTIKKIPAVIEFNHKELLNDLENNLKRYDKLTFTEDETTDLRKTLSKLRKGASAVDDYRKATKKELNAPVKKFEDKCKEIVNKFDERISKLDKQLKDFETERKAKKTVKVQEIIANVLNEFPTLEKKYADRLLVEDEHLAKSISNNRIKESIEFKAQQLLQEQENEQLQKEHIEHFVDMKNHSNGLNLSIQSYLSQLVFKTLQDVKTTIEDDVQKELARKSREEAEKQAQEELKGLKSVAQQASDSMMNKMKKEIEEIRFLDAEPITAGSFIIDDLPFGDVVEERERSVTLGIVVTESQLNIVKKLLDGQGIHWEVWNDVEAK